MATLFLRLKGGLGNQLFQYATARTIADQADVPLVAIVSDYERASRVRWSFRNPLRPAPYSRFRFGLDAFNTRLDDVAATSSVVNYAIVRARHEVGRPLKLGVLDRRYPDFHPELLDATMSRLREGKSAVLEGYFQSEMNFLANEDSIRSDLRLRRSLSGAALDVRDQILGRDSTTAIHIRRGDRAGARHQQCLPSVEFFRKGLEKIRVLVPDVCVIGFSDDPEWSGANIDLGHPAIWVPRSVGPAESIELMALCDNFVIGNSTFSWWGAWLGRDPAKCVVAPARWFADQRRRHPNILPRSWTTISDGGCA